MPQKTKAKFLTSYSTSYTYTGVGTYSFGANHLFNSAIYIPKAVEPANSFGAAFAGDNVGQVEITLDDGAYVEGVFSFECANQNDRRDKMF